MASNITIPPSAQAVISKCELCDRGNDARWFCTTCGEEMCKECKTTHLRSKASRNHEIIKIAKDIDTSNADRRAKESDVCSSHPKEQVQMYCIDCEVLVCITCIAGKHKNHSFGKILDTVGKSRNEITQCVHETKQEISELRSTLLSVKNNEQTYKSEFAKTIDEINEDRQRRKTEIDKIADSLIQQAKMAENNDLQEINKQDKEIRIHIADKNVLLQTCEDALQSTNNAAIVQFGTSIKKREKFIPRPSFVSQPRYIRDNTVKMSIVLGQLQTNKPDMKSPGSANVETDGGISNTVDTTVIANIIPDIDSVCVSTVNDRQAWVGVGYGLGNNIGKINIGGKVIKKAELDFTLYDITVTSTGELLVTESGGHHIKKFTKSGKFLNIADTSTYETQGLCMTSDDHILVCLYRDQSRSKIIRLTSTGQTQQTIQYDQNKASLFTDPSLVTENINNDVCVVDGYNTVVVVNHEGQLRFRYPDSAISSSDIRDCYGIVCDKLGFILISDYWYHRVHQVDKDGHFIQYILTEQHGVKFPWELSLDNKGQLWICNDCDKVTVVKYRSK